MILNSEKEKGDEEEEQEEEDDEEDEDGGEEEESFIFREVAAQWLMSETCKTAGHQLFPLVLILPECRKQVLELHRRKLGLEP